MQLDTIIDIDAFQTEMEKGLDDLTEAMRTQTAHCAYYGTLHVRAKRQLERVELTVKAVEAKLKTKHRARLTDQANQIAQANNAKPERVTVDQIEAAVSLDSEFIKWQQTLADAREIEGICKIAYEAFKTRSSMIISMGNMTRDQMKANLSTLSAKQEMDVYRERAEDRKRRAEALRK